MRWNAVRQETKCFARAWWMGQKHKWQIFATKETGLKGCFASKISVVGYPVGELEECRRLKTLGPSHRLGTTPFHLFSVPSSWLATHARRPDGAMQGGSHEGGYNNIAATSPAIPAQARLETCRTDAGFSGMVGGVVEVGTTVGTRVTPVPVAVAELLPTKLVSVATRDKLMVLVIVAVDVMVVVLSESCALTATRGRMSAAMIDLICILKVDLWFWWVFWNVF